LRRAVGQGLLVTAPRLMHLLALVGTIAMFMVGGGILVHGWPFVHHLIEGAATAVATLPAVGAALALVTPTLLNAVAGVVAGLVLVLAMTLVSKLKPAK
jgi:predicted DNA repair protein MutK